MTMDIELWLGGLGLAQYAQAFADNDIDAAMLSGLTDADLKELGVRSLGHRKRLLAAIAQMPASGADAPPVAQPALDKPVAPAVSAPVEERRQVTVLFADLCGFTALSQTLDTEELPELMGRFPGLVDGIVLAYGGTIDKHIGDAVMALFGAPRAHDDDPLRAARAALDIHEALSRMTTRVAQPLQAHIGIASGEVIAGALRR